MKDKVYEYFAELLLAIVFLALQLGAMHLVHKADAGGDDAVFIAHLESSADVTLGVLTLLITKKAGITGDDKKTETKKETTP